MNKTILTNKLKELSFNTGVDYNLLLLRFFMEEFLTRISLSQYKDDFVFKGGFLLSSLLGVSNRTTMDMDISVRNYQLEETLLKNAVKSIIKNCGNQSISFEIKDVKSILEGNQYEGLCVKLIGKLENIRQPFSIDFATGDPITPSAINYDYHLMINDKVIMIKSYNLETVAAEKLQTIISKGLANSRSKDFYNLYTISRIYGDDMDKENLYRSIQNTFQYRETKWNVDEILSLLDMITTSKIMEKRWNQFSKTHPFANNLLHRQVLDEISNFVQMVQKEEHKRYAF